ncbi:hypothetical protein D9757_011225 [Collybiopsis confluens]|uniref:F-box domain-containing protein n=1 Tax=Collybiopsis confluens TaxID=2823264 RepID=A0A8H5LSR8_9AGAR|nr:hypothetical protein D9757_011225 [Collybiopsis confluens]
MYSYNLTTATTTITLCTYPPPPPALPFELISLIIQATHPTKASLSNYALVSKSWTYPAQHLLFQHLSLHSQSDYLSFQYAIQRTPALANTVRSIRVLIDSNQLQPQGGGVSQFQFGQVVQVCEGLNEVDISLFGEASFEEGLIAKLRSRPGISSLRFMNWSGDVYALVQLLSGCRFLQNLVIGGSTPPEVPLRAVSSDGDGDGEIDASFSAAPFPCTLTKLGLVFQRSPSIDFFRWLLDNSKESLKVLDIERELEGWATATTSHRSSPALISSTQVSATLSSSSSTSLLYHPPFPIPPPPPPPSSHSSSSPTSSAISTASSSPTATPLTSASTSASSSTPTTTSTPTPTTTTTTPPLHHLLHTFHLTLVSLYIPTCSRSTAKVIEKCRMLKRVVVEDATCTCVAFVPPPPSASSVTNNGTGLPLSTIGGIGAGVGGVMRSLLIRRTGTGPGTGTGEAGLEHLAFGIDSDTSLQGVLDYVRRGGRGRELGSPSSASPSSSALSPTSFSGTELEGGSGSTSHRSGLKSITLYFRDDYDYDAGKKHGYGHKQIASLRMACAMAGVELKLVGASAREEGGVKQFRALVRDR